MKTVKSRILHAAMRLFAEKGSMQISISDLAKEAGLSRGTIYNNVENTDELFSMACDAVYVEMRESVRASSDGMHDPAARLSVIINQVIRRVHEETDWGRFVALFAMSDPRLGRFWGRDPAVYLLQGLETGRFEFEREQIHSITGMAGGAVFGAMSLVLNGVCTWRQSGSDTAELILRAVGVDRAEARSLATIHYAPLPRVDFSSVGQAGAIRDKIPS
ncbi:transcriptional regulator, TetR family [Thalassovita taeanensis]|uniref:Transcriptional regulator, TetR family n=2 Tax=Thalassovita taeanensis TaxID=657014 RepID=A0A1H9AIM4_9RHOB|nr:transcriptional regulator, TetR family [Thalassovita taeanensis]